VRGVVREGRVVVDLARVDRSAGRTDGGDADNSSWEDFEAVRDSLVVSARKERKNEKDELVDSDCARHGLQKRLGDFDAFLRASEGDVKEVRRVCGGR
jgi:hypothetical protein